ncbi:NAD(P)/FAD-dependent oxidoreductase [Amycolatopsis alkalitolerans]|uniref:FAD-dependent oxidoreductase n=1 Tax=Amycolatopsis alkalitolerans TaxID=2547244 RepID=A0A5C4M142_9PSEU|nr:FAD/NAD(P)-binding oxidoreductase [Amycolatopsis alkalitolerans]TNC25461.1 FAD-dependent oxidoreductase [Amycolatopsis alkalitolerans]
MASSPADIAVIGAGPAGLAAAVAASRAGAKVALIDGNARVGGQYWRHREGDTGRGHHHWSVLTRLRAGAPEFLGGHQVWHVERTGDGFTVHTCGGEIACRTLIIATGAYDRQLPFPGWTLPGVFTAGGAQALLKGHGVTAGRRIVVAGTGPFLLPVAAGLAEAGARVVGVFEAGAPTGFARHPGALAANPGKLAEGAGYLRTLARHRIPYRTRTTVTAAHGTESVSSATVAVLDEGWRVVREREVDCDAIAVGYGFTPQLEIPLQLGCSTRADRDGSLVACADEQQRASVPGVYLAGEVCGVGGAPLSLVEGELAGLHAALTTIGAEPDGARVGRLLRRRRANRAFAAALHEVHPVRRGWLDWLDGRTQLCRCEEVTVDRVRESIVELGATDARSVKLMARPGMGLCQGRVCGYATSCFVADACGRQPAEQDLLAVATRPIAQPITLGALAHD